MEGSVEREERGGRGSVEDGLDGGRRNEREEGRVGLEIAGGEIVCGGERETSVEDISCCSNWSFHFSTTSTRYSHVTSPSLSDEATLNPSWPKQANESRDEDGSSGLLLQGRKDEVQVLPSRSDGHGFVEDGVHIVDERRDEEGETFDVLEGERGGESRKVRDTGIVFVQGL